MSSHTELPELQEQFETPTQQKEASTLGMWIFLATEIMFFGGLFLVFGGDRVVHHVSLRLPNSNL